MFERTVSFWQRLIGSRPRQADIATAEEDRRVWVRYPADLAITYRRAGSSDKTPLSARVINISVGGMSLSVDRPCAGGDLLSVELPGPTAQATYTVLACVVHVVPEEEGRWTLGCTFARELNDEDLEPFGAHRERTQDEDQRSWVRYSCDVQASYQLVAGGDPQQWPAKVLNISASGIGLLVERVIETGTLLSVDLLSASGKSGRTMLSCVVHVTRQSADEWALGCNFITEMSEEDLKALL